jgi:hypothetical protein
LIVLMLMEAASTGPVYSTAGARQTADRCGALQRFFLPEALEYSPAMSTAAQVNVHRRRV